MARLRDNFDSGEITVMQWTTGTKNISDALTKRNIQMHKKLNEVLATGTLDSEIIKDQSV